MRYRLRTLLIVLAGGPPALAGMFALGRSVLALNVDGPTQICNGR